MTRRQLLFTPQAQRDLDEIWRYSAKEWSDERADHYIRALIATCETVAQRPDIARRRDDVKLGYRAALSGSHIIFFKISGPSLIVVRILHQRMDVIRHM